MAIFAAQTAAYDTTIWSGWNNTITTTSTTATTTIWTNWVGNLAVQAPLLQISNEQYQRQLETARAEQAAIAQRVQAAQARAQELLEGHLTSRQLATLKAKGWFIVKGGRSKREYAIHNTGIAGNIIELNKRRSVARLCCHADYSAMPMPDHWLTQKLWIEHGEDDFHKAANRTQVAECQYDEAA